MITTMMRRDCRTIRLGPARSCGRIRLLRGLMRTYPWKQGLKSQSVLFSAEGVMVAGASPILKTRKNGEWLRVHHIYTDGDPVASFGSARRNSAINRGLDCGTAEWITAAPGADKHALFSQHHLEAAGKRLGIPLSLDRLGEGPSPHISRFLDELPLQTVWEPLDYSYRLVEIAFVRHPARAYLRFGSHEGGRMKQILVSLLLAVKAIALSPNVDAQRYLWSDRLSKLEELCITRRFDPPEGYTKNISWSSLVTGTVRFSVPTCQSPLPKGRGLGGDEQA